MSATVTASVPGVGGLLREWRHRRRLSQLDLAVEAEVSARHLSFVETGRSKPSRELVLHLADHLDVPLRDRNTLLLSAGYAPVFHQTPFQADEMAPVREALDRIVQSHAPYPALVVDRHWDIVLANGPAMALLDGVEPALLSPTPNALRVSLHPDGLAARIDNLTEWAHHLLSRLDRQLAVSDQPALAALREELRSYPNMPEATDQTDLAGRLFVPLVLRVDNTRRLRLFSTIATFGTALDITVAELAIESFFPADPETAAALTRQRDGAPGLGSSGCGS